MGRGSYLVNEIKSWAKVIGGIILLLFLAFALLFGHKKTDTVPIPPWHQPPMCPTGEVCNR